MDYLVEYFKTHNLCPNNKPATKSELIRVQKELRGLNFATLPEAFIAFLYEINGLKHEESAILGLNQDDDFVDIVKFNQKFNPNKNTLILAYDEFTFLLYDETQNKYFLLGRDLLDVLDEYLEQELDLALNSLIHVDDD